MKFTLIVPALALVVGCGGLAFSDGTTTTTGAYVDEPAPVNVETYPRYEYHGEYVYNVNGRYFRRHGERWMRFRERPRDLDDRRDVRIERREDRVERHDDVDHDRH